MDKRIGHQFLQAGLGWGGSCFGKDTSALVAVGQQHGVQMQIVRAAREVNYAQRQRVVAKLKRELGTLEGKVVGLLGLAFKPHTDDLRDSPALDIARQLVAHGAVVRAHDPEAFERQQLPNLCVELCQSVDLLAEDADALILATEWPQYQTLEWEALASVMHNPLMLDGRNALDRKALEGAGFQYVGMGQPDRPFGRPQVRSVQPARGNLVAAGRMVAGQLRSFDRLFSERVPAPA
jgi:UDPglucose 6-dehydrogenase